MEGCEDGRVRKWEDVKLACRDTDVSVYWVRLGDLITAPVKSAALVLRNLTGYRLNKLIRINSLEIGRLFFVGHEFAQIPQIE